MSLAEVSMEEPQEPSYRTYWHSDHYRNQVGNSFIGPIWDVLEDHPEGVTIPEIRNALINDRRIRAAQSWLISFGAEQRHRPGAQFHDRYRNMDPKSKDSENWTWDGEKRYRYALLERVYHQVTAMIKEKTATSIGSSKVEKIQISDFTQIIPGRSDRVPEGHLSLYRAGEIPLITAFHPECQCGKSHHKTYKRRWVHHEGLGPDPYVLRENWRVEVENALLKERISNARELLERAISLMPKE
jgi:hypothetical protein